MHERLAVYVPNPDAPDIVALQLHGIAPKSGIVGRPDESDPRQASRTLIYFEGNLFGAMNIKTFADRCMLAAGRLTESYPTTAMRAVLTEALTQVGWYHDGHGVDPLPDGLALYRLAEYLELPLRDLQLTRELHAELRLSRP